MDSDPTSNTDTLPLIITPDPLAAFGDGSFNDEFHFGAWAYVIPELNLLDDSAGPGKSIRQFELTAACEALTRLIAHDQSDRPIQIFSDCTFTVRLIKELNKQIRRRDAAEPVAGEHEVLLRRLMAILQKRKITCCPAPKHNHHHRTCHLRARARLRAAIASNPALKQRMDLKRLTLHLNQKMKERDKLLASLRGVDEDIGRLQVSIADIGHRYDNDQSE